MNLIVWNGDVIHRGDPLAASHWSASPDLRDILRLLGRDALWQSIIAEVTDIYHSHRIDLDDRHVEVILSRMVRPSESGWVLAGVLD